MGRPIRKDRMLADFPGATAAGTNRIAVTAFRTGGSTTSSSVAYIVSQRGSNQFKIHLNDSSEQISTLTAVPPGSLSGTHNSFCVQVILDDSTVAFVNRFYNNTVHCTDGSGNNFSVKYTLGTETTDEGGGSGSGAKASKNTGSIDVV
tara:strand:- start:3199 stop:3642 length:444 start_codon:yes stop_codon:yes gene_type:complete